MSRFLACLIFSCLLLSVSTYVLNTNLHRLTKRNSKRQLYVGDKTREEYRNDLAWIAHFPMDKLQGARYEWLSG
ncbi:hypothetical protein PENTCL1PPCAC_29340 [Pristionchus entomophagus]|uniref:Uncharacterized protein n=1 Tax=Pristionchus entomophagus TaxID=358040 RepID=A0AAV5UJD8_9BILA|nr:hypothetical protein PENTCL1PPCAC_29340 [Pristionchus entomophagus]